MPDPLACCQVMCQIQGPEQSGQENVGCLGFKCQMLWPWNIIDREKFRYVFFFMDPFNVCHTSVWYRGQQVLGVWTSCARSIGPGTSRTAQYSGRLFLHVVSFIVCHTSIRRCAERQSEGLVKGLDVCCRPRVELRGDLRGLASS